MKRNFSSSNPKQVLITTDKRDKFVLPCHPEAMIKRAKLVCKLQTKCEKNDRIYTEIQRAMSGDENAVCNYTVNKNWEANNLASNLLLARAHSEGSCKGGETSRDNKRRIFDPNNAKKFRPVN